MQGKSIEDEIREIGLGFFDLVGLSTAQTPKSFDFYKTWLSEGRHGDMKYLERHAPKKANPQLLLENAQTWISVFLRYDTDEPLSTEIKHQDTGWIARYARGTDYHQRIQIQLQLFIEKLKPILPNAEFRTSVDIEPVLERDIAHQASLGWIGKNTCLINPKLGSFGFLGEILTTAKLLPDKPVADHCGSCTRCLDACPTGALIAPRILDARLCISTWTIEVYREPPAEVSKNLKNNFFGCDICQDVCPWNTAARKKVPLPKAQSSGVIKLDEIINSEDQELKKRFENTSMSRAKPEQLKRTAQIIKDSSKS